MYSKSTIKTPERQKLPFMNFPGTLLIFHHLISGVFHFEHFIEFLNLAAEAANLELISEENCSEETCFF